jgi:hypothetical protein
LPSSSWAEKLSPTRPRQGHRIAPRSGAVTGWTREPSGVERGIFERCLRRPGDTQAIRPHPNRDGRTTGADTGAAHTNSGRRAAYRTRMRRQGRRAVGPSVVRLPFLDNGGRARCSNPWMSSFGYGPQPTSADGNRSGARRRARRSMLLCVVNGGIGGAGRPVMGHSFEGRLLSSHAMPMCWVRVTGRQIVSKTTGVVSGSYRVRPVTAIVRRGGGAGRSRGRRIA